MLSQMSTRHFLILITFISCSDIPPVYPCVISSRSCSNLVPSGHCNTLAREEAQESERSCGSAEEGTRKRKTGTEDVTSEMDDVDF